MPKETFINLPEEKRKRIIDSAIQSFSKMHYKKVTIDAIVNGAGIPKGSFYQYFKNKEDLYLYIFNQIGDEKKRVLDELRKDVDTLNFKDYVMKMLQNATAYENKDSAIVMLKHKFMNECPQETKKEVLKNEIPKSHRLLEEVLRLYIEKGELRKDLDIKTCAYMITAVTVNVEHYELNEGEKLENIIGKMFDILIQGIHN